MAPHLEGHDIAFNASDRKSWKKYARSIDEYLRRECGPATVYRVHISSEGGGGACPDGPGWSTDYRGRGRRRRRWWTDGRSVCDVMFKSSGGERRELILQHGSPPTTAAQYPICILLQGILGRGKPLCG